MKRLMIALWCSHVAMAAAVPRPETWAVPVKVAGVPNLHRVAPGLYRSAQPTAEGLRELQRLGFRTVINLRVRHDAAASADGLPLRMVSLGMSAWRLSKDRLAQVLAVLRDPALGPVLVHCRHGADRTGIVCALFRMSEQGWTREDAIRELRAGGYGYHAVFHNITHYLRGLDVAEFRERINQFAPARAPSAG